MAEDWNEHIILVIEVLLKKLATTIFFLDLISPSVVEMKGVLYM